MTRFIALASVGNPAKAKSLHALALTPAADMDIAALTQRPDGTTPCPYELPSASKRPFPGQDEGTGGQVCALTCARASSVTADPVLVILHFRAAHLSAVIALSRVCRLPLLQMTV